MADRIVCHGCKRDVQPDENLAPVQEPGAGGATVSYLGCPDCVARVTGEPKAVKKGSRTFPPGVFLCGICDGQFHEQSVSQHTMRLHADDVADTEVKPGHYVCCGNCQESFRSKIAARLKATDKGFQQHLLRANKIPHGEILDLAQDPAALAAKVESLSIDPVPHCQGNWLR